MAEPFIGEIRQVGFNFSAVGWLPCNGQLLPISENEALYTLLGTTYGGDGVQTFGLPNLQGRIPVHQGQLTGGSNYLMGQMAGVEAVTINTNQLANHTHAIQASNALGTVNVPTTKSTWAQVTADGSTGNPSYAASPGNAILSPTTVSTAGASMPLSILQPYVVVNFMIATVGIYPTQS